jgi:hypothetical protein
MVVKKIEIIIKMYGKSDPDFVWKSITSYQDLVDVNVAFLNGKLSRTPYHSGPIDKETVPLLKKLIKINKMGFVSIEGQPAVCSYKNITTKNIFGKEIGKMFYDEEQKSYSVGILPLKYLAPLRAFLSKRKDVYYLITDRKKTLDYKYPDSNLTRKRFNRDKMLLSVEKWLMYTNATKNIKSVLRLFKGIGSMDKIIDSSMLIIISGTEYCSGSVEDIIFDFLKKQK